MQGLDRETEALEDLTRAVRLAKRTRAHHVTIYALHRRGVLYTHQERLDMAHGDLARASVVLDSAGLREHETVVSTALGEMYVLKADRGAARAEFGRAITAGELRPSRCGDNTGLTKGRDRGVGTGFRRSTTKGHRVELGTVDCVAGLGCGVQVRAMGPAAKGH